MKKITPAIKIALAVFLTFLSVEISLRIIGYVYLRQTYSNNFDLHRDSKNILILGESTAAGLWVSPNESYPMQLQSSLKGIFPDETIRVIVPLHMGQNTGQMSNRIRGYIRENRPRIMVIMAGYNNEWSLAESHISEFITGPESIWINTLAFLDRFRTFRLIRYFYLFFDVKSNLDQEYLLGGPEYSRYPPEKSVYEFSRSHRKEFVELWRSDIAKIIDAGKENNITVILMTYHINPTYLPAEEFSRMADEKKIILIRNDLSFDRIIKEGNLQEFVFKADNWHPNYYGYRIIAENLEKEIIEKKMLVD